MHAVSSLTTRSLFAFATLAIGGNAAFASLPDFSGQPVVELVEFLRDAGERIVYDRDQVPIDLEVTVAPRSEDDFVALGEILAPHGLGVEPGPRGTWVIVRQDSPGTDAPGAGPVLTPPSLETVVVTASRYPIERQSAASASTFGRHALETTPALGQDPMRVTHRLPGVTSDQLSSRMHIRGGDLDEVLLLLDGVRLFSPYHLKDFQNVFSSINPRILDSMAVRTGGYEARYGDRSSGVIDMKSIRPTEARHHELSTSLLESDVLSSGLFAQGRGAWVTSIRRGNLDMLADTSDSDIGTPQYVDFYNRIDYALSAALQIEGGILSLDDKISLNDGNTASATTDSDDFYYWITLRQSATSGLESTYRFSSASLDRTRTGRVQDPTRVDGSLMERERFERRALTAEWSLPASALLWFDWGVEFAQTDLRHRIESSRNEFVTIVAPQLSGLNALPANAALDLDQNKRAAWLSLRYQPLRRLVGELGVRRDSQSLTGEDQLSPRINLRFDITNRTRISAAWGEYAQSDSLEEIALADGEAGPSGARISEQRVLALEHAFGDSGLLRVEVYDKDASPARSRHENLFERVSLLPELLPDRFLIEPVAAQSRGFELSLEGRFDAFSWWTNFAFSRARETLASGVVRRSWEEHRSIKAGGEWSGNRWNVTASLGYRSGWPISIPELTSGTLVVDAYNAYSLPDFSSVDVRASRQIEVAMGRLDWFIEVSNLADHANYCCLDYEIRPGSGGAPDELLTEFDDLLGLVPNLGIRWQF